jgi:hypothetical protein
VERSTRTGEAMKKYQAAIYVEIDAKDREEASDKINEMISQWEGFAEYSEIYDMDEEASK